jgi:hypothetical protein
MSRLAPALLALPLLVGCAGQPESPARIEAAPLAKEEAAARVAEAVWGVVPTAPRTRDAVAPELIHGSAVAVSEDTLLASCRILDGRDRVGLIQNDRYRLAEVTPAEPGEEVCLLWTPGERLATVSGSRQLADLVPGEPIYALVNRTGASYALVEGKLTGERTGDTRLGTSLVLPAGERQSVVLFDRHANLLGLAVPGAEREVGSMALMASTDQL